MKKLKKFTKLFVLFFIVFSIAGCTMFNNNLEQNITVAFEAGVHTLDPAILQRMNEQYIACNLWEGLVRKNLNGLIEPSMAKSWDVSEDGLTYIFHLRKNIHWSDGQAVTASQFEYAWKRALNPEAKSDVVFMMYFLKNGEEYNKGKARAEDVGVKALDNNTLEVRLEKPAPFFLEILNYHTYYPVRQDIVEKDSDSWYLKEKTLVTNGPFCVQSLDYNKNIMLVKNKYYWDQKNVKLASISFKIERQPDAIWKQYLEGSVVYGDTFPNDMDKQKEVETNKNNVIAQNALATAYICLNSRRAPLNNINVRKAFEMVLDKEKIVQARKRSENVATGFIPPGMPDVKPGTDFREIGGKYMNEKFNKDNIKIAKKLLEQAGYSNPKKFPTVVILATDPWKQTVNIIATQLKETLGINVDVRTHASEIFYQQYSKGDFDIVYSNWVADFVDPINFLGYMAGEKKLKGIFPEKFYSLVDKANSMADNVQRISTLHEAENDLLNSYTLIPLFYLKDMYYIKPYIKNYLRTPTAEIYFRNAYIEKHTN